MRPVPERAFYRFTAATTLVAFFGSLFPRPVFGAELAPSSSAPVGARALSVDSDSHETREVVDRTASVGTPSVIGEGVERAAMARATPLDPMMSRSFATADQAAVTSPGNLPAAAPTTEATAQSVSLPQGAGTVVGLGESLNVDLATGSLSFVIPVSLPQARGASQPQLAFAYNSSVGRGVAGMGWSFGAPAITRQLVRGFPSYQDPPSGTGWQPGQDRFVFGSAELVPLCVVSGGACSAALSGEAMPPWAEGWQYFRPNVEGGFVRFFWSPNHQTWRAQGKSGAIMEFGAPLVGPVSAADAGAVDADPNHPAHIYGWNLSRQFDAEDASAPGSGSQPVNLVVYQYLTSNATSYLQDIYDTPPATGPSTAATTAYAHHVHVTYETRTDPAISYQTGWQRTQGLRVTRVDVTSMPFSGSSSARELLKRYELTYDSTSHVSLLASVTVEGRCGDSGSTQVTEQGTGLLPWPTNCPTLPSINLTYTHVTDSSGNVIAPPAGFGGLEGIDTTVTAIAKSPSYSYGDALTTPYDINSDGLPDLLVTAPGQFTGGAHGVYLNGSGGQIGFGGAQLITMAPSTDPAVSAVTTLSLELSNPDVVPIDIDGEGVVDLLHMPVSNTYTVFAPTASGAGFQWVGRSINVPTGEVPDVDFTHWGNNARVMDVDGDGLVDIVHVTGTDVETYFGLGRYPGGDGQFGQAQWTGPTTATLSASPATSCVPWSSTPVQFSDSDIAIADMNGDGLPDIVRIRPGDVRYWPGRGQGFWGTGVPEDCVAGTMGEGQEVAMSQSPDFTNVGPFLLDDVNGDGLADLVRPLFGGLQIWLNVDGSSWTPNPDDINAPASSQITNQVRLVDIDGSGTKDVVWGIAGKYQYMDLQGGQRPWLLSSYQNGFGKTTNLAYQSSAQAMLGAQAQGNPWQSVMPIVLPVVTSVVENDNLSTGALGTGRYETDYTYRDPVYDGQRREFRGFGSSTTTHVGDSMQPTGIEVDTTLLGQCVPSSSDGYDVCAPSERWRDNPREPLKGLPQTSSLTDATGVTYTTTHHGYTLEQLYAGADGRPVELAFPNQSDAWVFETSPFTAGSTSASVVDVTDQMHSGAQTTSTLALAGAAFAHTRQQLTIDTLGNPTVKEDLGCIGGSSCAQADDVITITTNFARSAQDVTGWIFRPVETSTVSSANPSDVRHHVYGTYNAAGHLTQATAQLVGTLPLSRFHSTGAAVAPTLRTASQDATITLATYTYDEFGNVVETVRPDGQCHSITLDSAYASLPATEVVYAGSIQGACGTIQLQSTVTFDRGLEAPTSVQDANGDQQQVVYDGFGRPIRSYRPDPSTPGAVGSEPSTVTDYTLPSVSNPVTYSIVHTKTQDGPDASTATYHETWDFLDGLGRKRLAMEEADTSAGDGGPYVVGALASYGARGLVTRTYRPEFASTSPTSFQVSSYVPATTYAQRRFDAMGRQLQTYGFDGTLEVQSVYHPLSVDSWDAEDIGPGPHQGTPSPLTTDGHGRRASTIERLHVGGSIESHEVRYTYLATGEVSTITRVRDGASNPPVVRWMRYDSLGRLVLNVDPDASQGFNASPTTDPSTIKAWRYAYDDSGNMVGTSDARGCGENLYYDGAGRLYAEDYSPCLPTQAAYSAPDFTANTGIEVLNVYDAPDSGSSSIVDANGNTFSLPSGVYQGRLAATYDRGRHAVYAYDHRGRLTGLAESLAAPGVPSDTLSERYTSRWYTRSASFDAADRPVVESTGATVTELMGAGSQSAVTSTYSSRGVLRSVGSSYGVLVASMTRSAEGLPLDTVLGDAAGTTRALSYDQRMRVSRSMTYRGTPSLWSSPPASYTPATTKPPSTLQLLLEDVDLSYDKANNVTAITDWRLASEWPSGAAPVTRTMTYDDLYRVTSVAYQYPSGKDPWTSPFAAENSNSALPQPVPQVSFASRTLSESFSYDWLGNITTNDDDAHGFYDRSIGGVVSGTASAGPYQLKSASNKSYGGSRTGSLTTAYDAAGNLTGMVVQRKGSCIPSDALCSQQYSYEWDEIDQLAIASRWDIASTKLPSPTEPPTTNPAIELEYAYTASGERVRKTAVTASSESHDLYIFSALELREATYTGGDYSLTSSTEAVYLGAAGSRLARVVYNPADPSINGGSQHVFFELGDYLGSASIVIDHDTGELVERATYAAYGNEESDYRPARWQSYRDLYRYTGQEDDIAVGLTYCGSRYFSPNLARWISADPLTIHGAGSDLNAYAYVHGRPFSATDPHGQFAFLVFIAAAVIGAIVGFSVSVVSQGIAHGFTHIDWAQAGVAAAAGAVAGLVACGVGALIAPLFGTALSAGGAFASSAAQGAIAGGAAGAASYGTTFVGDTILSRHDDQVAKPGFGLGGFLAQVGLGALAGAVSGLVTTAFRSAWYNANMPAQGDTMDPDQDPSLQGSKGFNKFATLAEAQQVVGGELHDASMFTGREFGAYIMQNPDGTFSMDFIRGGSGYVPGGATPSVWCNPSDEVMGEDFIHSHPYSAAAGMKDATLGEAASYNNYDEATQRVFGDVNNIEARLQVDPKAEMDWVGPSGTIRGIWQGSPVNSFGPPGAEGAMGVVTQAGAITHAALLWQGAMMALPGAVPFLNFKL